MLDKIKNLPLSVILAASFLLGMMFLLCIFVPAVGITLSVVIVTALSVARILYFFFNGL